MDTSQQAIIRSVIEWFENTVLGLNLCPFAAQPYKDGRISFQLCEATNDEECLIDLLLALTSMGKTPAIETIVLICPFQLDEFDDYNQFLQLADELLEQEGWYGVYQIASFHPHYQFEGVPCDDISNWTNRSPYPILHLLREESLTRAIDSHKDVGSIPAQNMQRLRELNECRRNQLFDHLTGINKGRE